MVHCGFLHGFYMSSKWTTATDDALSRSLTFLVQWMWCLICTGTHIVDLRFLIQAEWIAKTASLEFIKVHLLLLLLGQVGVVGPINWWIVEHLLLRLVNRVMVPTADQIVGLKLVSSAIDHSWWRWVKQDQLDTVSLVGGGSAPCVEDMLVGSWRWYLLTLARVQPIIVLCMDSYCLLLGNREWGATHTAAHLIVLL